MATNEHCRIDQGNTFGLLLLVMYLYSTRDIAHDHGISSIRCNIYDSRSIEYDMARSFCEPDHAHCVRSGTVGSPHV